MMMSAAIRISGRPNWLKNPEIALPVSADIPSNKNIVNIPFSVGLTVLSILFYITECRMSSAALK